MTHLQILEQLRGTLEPWVPKQVSDLNNHNVRLVYFKGKFDDHYHENDDELFMVLEGTISLNIPYQNIKLNTGDSFVVPEHTIHGPSSEGAYVICIERKGSETHFI